MPLRRFPSIDAAAAAAVLCALLVPVPAAAAGLEGLWDGLMIFTRGEAEVEFTLEVARATDGKLVGTIDIPSQHLHYRQLDAVTLAGDQGAFSFTWMLPGVPSNTSVSFSGMLSTDGQRFDGVVVESDAPGVSSPFRMKRLGEPGAPRKELRPAAVRPLSPAGAELKEAFNADAGKTRLVLLLSPT